MNDLYCEILLCIKIHIIHLNIIYKLSSKIFTYLYYIILLFYKNLYFLLIFSSLFYIILFILILFICIFICIININIEYYLWKYILFLIFIFFFQN